MVNTVSTTGANYSLVCGISDFLYLKIYFDNTRYMISEERYGPLAQMEVKDFVYTVGARSPSPGGGSVAALSASMVITKRFLLFSFEMNQ